MERTCKPCGGRTLYPDMAAALAILRRNSRRFLDPHEAQECATGNGWHLYRIEKRSPANA